MILHKMHNYTFEPSDLLILIILSVYKALNLIMLANLLKLEQFIN